jgi:hypothetical protein
MPGWPSRKASIWLMLAPVDCAVGRRIVATARVGTPVPFAAAYCAKTAGPASMTTELPARLAAFQLKATVALTCG